MVVEQRGVRKDSPVVFLHSVSFMGMPEEMVAGLDFLYAVQRGSNANDHSIPECVDKIIKLYRSFL